MQERTSDPADRNRSIHPLACSWSAARKTRVSPWTETALSGRPAADRHSVGGTGDNTSSTYLTPPFPTRSSTVPSATFRPLCSMTTRSQSASTSERMWELKKTVFPEDFNSRMRLRTSILPIGSSPDIGSSGMSSSGAGRRAPAGPGPDPAAGFRPSSRLLAEHGDRPGIGEGETVQDLDRRGLPGAVGAEEPDELVRPDGKRQVGEGAHATAQEAGRIRVRA